MKALNKIEEITTLVASDVDEMETSLENLKLLIADLENLNTEKLGLATSINELIKAKIGEFKRLMDCEALESLSDEAFELTPVKEKATEPEQPLILENVEILSEVPVEVPVEKKKGRRGRKPKKPKVEGDETDKPLIPNESSNLMMLVDVAIKREEKSATKKRKRRSKNQVKAEAEETRESEEDGDQAEAQDNQGENEADENEPVYCICSGISWGPMIMCDNEACSIEWFHFSCVGVKKAQKGKWYVFLRRFAILSITFFLFLKVLPQMSQQKNKRSEKGAYPLTDKNMNYILTKLWK